MDDPPGPVRTWLIRQRHTPLQVEIPGWCLWAAAVLLGLTAEVCGDTTTAYCQQVTDELFKALQSAAPPDVQAELLALRAINGCSHEVPHAQ